MKKLLLPKSYYLEFAAATLLYIVNVLLTLFSLILPHIKHIMTVQHTLPY